LWLFLLHTKAQYTQQLLHALEAGFVMLPYQACICSVCVNQLTNFVICCIGCTLVCGDVEMEAFTGQSGAASLHLTVCREVILKLMSVIHMRVHSRFKWITNFIHA
jgi:hypothetical protein